MKRRGGRGETRKGKKGATLSLVGGLFSERRKELPEERKGRIYTGKEGGKDTYNNIEKKREKKEGIYIDSKPERKGRINNDNSGKKKKKRKEGGY